MKRNEKKNSRKSGNRNLEKKTNENSQSAQLVDSEPIEPIKKVNPTTAKKEPNLKPAISKSNDKTTKLSTNQKASLEKTDTASKTTKKVLQESNNTENKEKKAEETEGKQNVMQKSPENGKKTLVKGANKTCAELLLTKINQISPRIEMKKCLRNLANKIKESNATNDQCFTKENSTKIDSTTINEDLTKKSGAVKKRTVRKTFSPTFGESNEQYSAAFELQNKIIEDIKKLRLGDNFGIGNSEAKRAVNRSQKRNISGKAAKKQQNNSEKVSKKKCPVQDIASYLKNEAIVNFDPNKVKDKFEKDFEKLSEMISIDPDLSKTFIGVFHKLIIRNEKKYGIFESIRVRITFHLTKLFPHLSLPIEIENIELEDSIFEYISVIYLVTYKFMKIEKYGDVLKKFQEIVVDGVGWSKRLTFDIVKKICLNVLDCATTVVINEMYGTIPSDIRTRFSKLEKRHVLGEVKNYLNKFGPTLIYHFVQTAHIQYIIGKGFNINLLIMYEYFINRNLWRNSRQDCVRA